MVNVLMVGQFPPPVTGEAQVNLIVKNILEGDGYVVKSINSSIIDSVNDVGNFGITKILKALKIIFSSFFFIFRCNILYITPGQSLFGLFRFYPLVFLSSLLKRKIIIHWHGYGVYPLFVKYPKLVSFFFNEDFSNILLTNDLLKKLYAAGLNCRHAIAIPNFSEAPLNQAEVISSNKKLKVLYMGGLMSEKGINIFLDAASSPAGENYNFLVCGAGNKFITDKICELDVAGKIEFHGLVDFGEKVKILQASDIFVLQTTYVTEGVPLTILEAMASGCAVVTTRHNGIPETVGDAALFVEPSSLESLLGALKLLDEDRAALMSYKTAAISRSKSFSFENFRNQILDVFNCEGKL